jgi:carbon storage regulator
MEAKGELPMLVLSRRLNQAIVIAGEVRVTVLAITPSRVEVGVEAPREIMVDREEIHLRRQECRIPAANEQGCAALPKKQ